jgi:S-adenosylmethionine:tRNA ribosyltransferase-isomerase
VLLSRAMRRSDFRYHLPQELIASRPLHERSASRLLRLYGRNGRIEDRLISDLPGLLLPGDVLVFNDTRVIRARLAGHKDSGGRVEVLVERIVDRQRTLAHVRSSKAPRRGARLRLEGVIEAHIEGRDGDLFVIVFEGEQSVLELLEAHGHVPLPPYIARPDLPLDRERYQTVFARVPGAVAAPTAGLHFDAGLLARLSAHGVECGFITLHVGAGTFVPLRSEDLQAHRMHEEFVEVRQEACATLRRAKARGGRVIAVGTTVVRALETAARGGEMIPYTGHTDLFIRPCYRFRAIDGMITNFHLPESTLLILVCAFGGHHHVMTAYRHAIEQRYRFYSYGDAMFVTP